MTEREKERAYATKMENHYLFGDKKAIHKKWKNIVSELSDREITLEDICNPESNKQLGLLEVVKDQKMSLGDLALLRQYGEAILNGSTRAAEFLRDTMGEKPTTQIDMNVEEKGLKKMSYEELLELKENLERNCKQFENLEKQEEVTDDTESI